MTNPAATILIVDDEIQNRKLLEALLRPEGYLTLSAANGEEALASIARQAPDLILLDVMMPGMDGYQLAGILKADPATSSIPIIMVTTQNDRVARLAGLNAGAEAFLTKPVDRAELWLRVRNLLRVKTLGDLLKDHGATLERQVQEQVQAIRASEVSYRRLFEAAQDGILILDFDTGRIDDVNPYLSKLLGFTPGEMIGKTVGELSPFKEIEPNQVMLERLHNDGYARYDDLPLEASDGRRVAVEFASNVYQAGGKQVIQCTIRDITERRNAECRIVYLNRVYATLSAISALIVRERDRDQLYREACRIAVEEGGFRMSLIAIVSAGAMKIVPAASAGKDKALLSAIEGLLSSSKVADTTMVARAIREKQAVVANDSQRDPMVLLGKQYAASGVRSIAVLPLVVSGEATGVLALYASEIDFFHEDELKLLTELAGDIAFALEHIDKEEKIARLSRIQAVMSGINSMIVRVRNRQELFDETCRVAVEHGKFGAAWISVFDASTLEAVQVAAAGHDLHPAGSRVRIDIATGVGVASRAIRGKHPVFDNDMTAPASPGGDRRPLALEAGFQSMVALPFMVEGVVVGHLSLYTKEPGFFTEDELKPLTDLAGNISFALEHIRKEERIARLSRIQAVTGGINALMIRVHERQELFDGACRIAVEQGRFAMAWIGALDPVTQDVTPIAWAGEGAEDLTKAQSSARDDTPRGKGAVGQAIRGRRPIHNNDITIQGFGGPRLREIVRLGFRSQITLPLYEGQAVVGVLTMYVREPNFFDEEELRLLTGLAKDISFAIENISRQKGLAKLARIRSVSSEINATIARIHDREALLRETCRIAVEHGKFKLVWVAWVNRQEHRIQPVEWEGFTSSMAQGLTWERTFNMPGATLPEVIRTRKVAVRNDIDPEQTAGRLRQEAMKRGFRSTVCVPFMVDDSVVAAMILFAEGRNFFDDEELALLNEISTDVSFALDRIDKGQKIARLYRIQAVMASTNALIARVHDRQELFDEACRIAVEHGNFGTAWIGAFDASTLEVAPVAWAGLQFHPTGSHAPSSSAKAMGVVSRAIREKRPVFDNNIADHLIEASPRRALAVAAGFRSLVALPLLAEGAVVGQLSLYTKEPDFFNEDELKLLVDLAGNISFAIENINRQQKLDKLGRIRAISSEINASIVRIHERDALLREICRIAVEHGKFELVWIASVDMEKQEVRPIVWAGFSPEVARAVNWALISTTQGTLNEAMLTRKPAVRNDTPPGEQGGNLRQEALQKNCLSTVCLPLLVDDKVVALVALFAPGAEFFDDDELALLGEVAADVSFALQAIEKQTKLEYLSYYDMLTGLPNRTLFNETLKKTLALASDRGWLVAVLCIDLDYFKNVNDTLGHAIGDELLTQFSARLIQCVRIRDTVGRLGGDEFSLILLMEDGKEGAAHVANKIRDALRAPFDLKGHEVAATASIGITIHPDDASDPETLMKYADTAMYRAKQAGRDTFRFFTAQMNVEVVARLDLETALRRAIENDEFVLHYQPKVQLSSGRISGLEALLRWQRPGHGLVPPKDFIPVLEETGLIVRVGSWVVAAACRQIGHWMRSPIGPVQVSVNVSGRQFIEGDLHGDIVKALGDNGIAAHQLELEMTESSLMANTERTIASLQNLKKLGVQISIDDFGTGYSSLAYLSRFPIDILKIDIAFIRDVTSNPDHAAIVLAVIRMAHGLKLDTIAEGVETAAQLAYLRRHHCDFIQGYYFSRPLPAQEMEQMLREGKCLPGPETEAGAQIRTLLLVDDDVAALAFLQHLLREDGYQILSAGSAAEGFELLALHPVQVILCDQNMPGMNGTVFLDQVKDLYPDTFRIVLSGHTDLQPIMDAINRGAIHRFYTKEWSGQLARENVREAFRQHRLLHEAQLAHGSDPAATLPPGQLAGLRARQWSIPASPASVPGDP